MKFRSNRGFTLVELMITVAIVAILATVAYPSYQDHVLKSRRADGISAIMNAAQRLERCYTQYGAYNNANCPSYAAVQDSQQGYYQVSFSAAATASTYTLRAVPRGAQADDTKCATLTLTQANQKGITGSGSVQDCW